MSTTLLRTQIYLPRDLREEIDKQRRQTGESLAEYLRKAAKIHTEATKRRKVHLSRLAKEFVGSSTKSNKEIERWLKEVREERRLSDKRLERRWKEARKLS